VALGARRPRWVTALLDLVFPPFCPVCKRRLEEARRDPLCGSCWDGLERIAAPYCRVCGLPFARIESVEADPRGPHPHLCGRCRRRSPPFAYARSAIRYDEIAREALHAFKFRGRRSLAVPLGDLLAELGASMAVQAPDLIVPVPLHRRRERERGFN